MTGEHELKRSLGSLMLWGLGVGYVISGMYFGWNLGLAEGGTYGLGIATIFVIVMYVTFTLSYTELACSMPSAGGAFVYANKALGKKLGFVAGMAQNIEFIFCPPAIAAAIGAYFKLFLPESWIQGSYQLLGLSFSQEALVTLCIAIIAYAIFTFINIIGVESAAAFELLVTLIAVAGLILFATVSMQHFKFENIHSNPLPYGYWGVFAAIPFAMWFFLAIECLANVAEETIEPQKKMVVGFGSAIVTLVILCILTFSSSVGIGGWEKVVYDASGEVVDAPLPLAIQSILGSDHIIYSILIGIGLIGLIASFHGIILAAGRATFEFGRIGYAPKILGKVHKKYKTPANALVVNAIIGVVAILSGKTGEIITIACFGALTLYIISMISLFKLRKDQPKMDRPFKVPFYPLFPFLAIIISSIALVSMAFFNYKVFIVYIVIMIMSFLWFIVFHKENSQTAV
ncbi:MAG: ethanolamine permease [Saprospiraceae bacterium]|nr:ethanolamine permease [Saprospiraceae bacterium]